jgi:hypothetical protein
MINGYIYNSHIESLIKEKTDQVIKIKDHFGIGKEYEAQTAGILNLSDLMMKKLKFNIYPSIYKIDGDKWTLINWFDNPQDHVNSQLILLTPDNYLEVKREKEKEKDIQIHLFKKNKNLVYGHELEKNETLADLKKRLNLQGELNNYCFCTEYNKKVDKTSLASDYNKLKLLDMRKIQKSK